MSTGQPPTRRQVWPIACLPGILDAEPPVQTSAGTAFATPSRAAVPERLFSRVARPVLTVSTTASIISGWLVPRLADFARSQPAISLHLSATYRPIDFARSGNIDAAIRFGKGVWANLSAALLCEDVVFPVCCPDIAKRLRRPDDPLRERLLQEDPHWDHWQDWFAQAGITESPPHAYRLSDDFNVQLQSAKLGQGVALARGMLVADDLRAGRLVCPFPIVAASPVQYYFVCPPEREREPAITSFRTWLLQAAADTVRDLGRLTGAASALAQSVSVAVGRPH